MSFGWHVKTVGGRPGGPLAGLNGAPAKLAAKGSNSQISNTANAATPIASSNMFVHLLASSRWVGVTGATADSSRIGRRAALHRPL